MSACDLTTALAQKQFTALQAATVLGIRALNAQHKVNCLAEVLIKEAVEEARKMDEHMAEKGPIGPLHGLPISIKDSMIMKGHEACMGHSSLIGVKHPRDSVLIKCIRRAGAIPYVKTNVPQTLLTFECYNPVFGRTLNPHNKHVAPGGSSGGEGALLASKASVLGIGSDIGGSVRIPAHCSGIYALKPTSFRVPLAETLGEEGFQEYIPVSVGPMARDVASLELFMKALIEQEPWTEDSGCVPLPWRTWQPPAKLCLGYYTYDGFLPAAPACQRAVRIAVDKLRAAGHEVVEFKPPNVLEAFTLFLGLLYADNLSDVRAILGNDDRCQAITPQLEMTEMHWITRKIKMWIATYWYKEPQLAQLLEISRARETALQECGRPFDAIICPGFGVPAVLHETAGKQFPMVCYTALHNVLDVTAGAIPVTTVDAKLDKQQENVSWLGGDAPISYIENTSRKFYDMDLLHGVPIGIQVFGERFSEERILGCMRIIDDCLKAS
ncbi:amidase signature domain-containing protein [Syncephalis fuscata]|nr:amidase signature domain-containing protein [Syncephalis fuscata]